MVKILSISLMVLLTVHGLIHLMGFIAYWPLGTISELPYKTTFLRDRWEIGSAGTRLLSLLWLLAALGFLAAALALAVGRSWWAPLLLGAVLLSLVLCVLDWAAAFRGAWIDVALLLVLLLVFGLRVKPAPFPPFAAHGDANESIPLPKGLPAPVERFYRQVYGDMIPVYNSAVLSGRGTTRLMGVTFPARIRFSHISGKEYRHYFEITFYGIPILKVNEWYLDGHNRLELPFGVVENDPCADSAANQGLWSESLGYPAFFLTDSRVRWESIDDTHASLFVPYGDSEQVFTIQFDPQSGRIIHFETERCRSAKAGTMRWWGDIKSGESLNGDLPGMIMSATWEDEGTPWLVFELEETAFNADLSGYIRQKGP
jgi:hypothetical protein